MWLKWPSPHADGPPGPAQGVFHMGGIGTALPLPLPGLEGGQAWALALSAVLGKLASDNSLLLQEKRERDIGVYVILYSNPMSKCAVEHNMRLQDIINDLVEAVTFNDQVVQASSNNIPQVNQALGLVLSGVQRLRDRIMADRENHRIAMTSELGWQHVSNLEGLEGQVGCISMVDLRAKEKAYLKPWLPWRVGTSLEEKVCFVNLKSYRGKRT